MRTILLAILLASPVAADGVYSYRLRGEVRLLLFWLGRDDVGGGRISLGRGTRLSGTWREEVEILFGSKPDRIPKGINRWGYGRELSDWTADGPSGNPRLTATAFQGIMRHSPEASIDEALAATRDAKAAQLFLYDITVSRVGPEQASSEFRVLTASEDFDYRSPDHLLSDYRQHIESVRPLRSNQLANDHAAYSDPYGFLTGVMELIDRSLGVCSPATLTFIYNARPYKLDMDRSQPVEDSKLRPQWKSLGVSACVKTSIPLPEYRERDEDRF